MMRKAKERQPGQVIRVEYGEYGNWQKFDVEAIKLNGSTLVAYVHSFGHSAVKTDLLFQFDEEVEVIAPETGEH